MESQPMKSTGKTRGFTLVEILVVVLIISLLAAFVAPKLFKGLGKTKRDIARSKMAILEDALGRFYLDCQRYPDQSEGLEALLISPSGIEQGKWNGPYLKKSELLDPWGNRYVYVPEGTVNQGSYDLISYGADGAAGGSGENSDIYND
jgi:general secretion pathway protein G